MPQKYTKAAVAWFLLTATLTVAFQPLMPQQRLRLTLRNLPQLPSKEQIVQTDESSSSVESSSNSSLGGNAALPVALAVAGLLGAGAYAALGSDAIDQIRNFDLQAFLRDLSDNVDGLGPLAFAYFSAVYISLEIFALPAFPLTASAGYLFGTIPGTAIVLFSATIAAGISFLIGRTFLRKRIESWVEGNKQFQAIDRAVGREGFKVVLLLRLSPLLPFALSNYLYGLTSVEFLPYLAGTALGFAPGSLAYVYTGNAAKALSDANQGLTQADGAVSNIPGYGYAAVLVFVLAFAKVVSDIASDALSEMEADQ